MKNILLTTLLLMTFISNAQHWKFMRHEVTLGIGTTNFLGELGGADDIGSTGITGVKDFEFKMTRPAFSAGYRYYISQTFAIKGELLYGRLNGDDALTAEPFRQNRNIHFRSPLIELTARFEYYPFKQYFGHLYRTNGVLGKKISKISPYLFVGVGGFWFNPKAQYNGSWEALQPLQTEGVAYKRIAANFPFGAGVKYAITKQFSIGFEMGLRYTTSDYVDDVSGKYIDHSSSSAMIQYLANPTINSIASYTDGSYVYNPTAPGMQRGNSDNKDSFLVTLFTANYKFLQGKRNLPKF